MTETMKPFLIAGNWKSNKTTGEAGEWLQKFKNPFGKTQGRQNSKWKMESVTVVLCVPFTLLSFLADRIQQLKLPIQLGAQDVSPFPEGAYTGEVSARQVKEFADWVIVGHSERRREFKEQDDMLFEKVLRAKEVGLQVIYCVQDEKTPVAPGVEVIAYEPPWAISTVSNWKTQDPTTAGQVCELIKKKNPNARVLYGGSANAENVQSFLLQSSIEGILSGGASLDAEKFYRLIEAASRVASRL